MTLLTLALLVLLEALLPRDAQRDAEQRESVF